MTPTHTNELGTHPSSANSAAFVIGRIVLGVLLGTPVVVGFGVHGAFNHPGRRSTSASVSPLDSVVPPPPSAESVPTGPVVPSPTSAEAVPMGLKSSTEPAALVPGGSREPSHSTPAHAYVASKPLVTAPDKKPVPQPRAAPSSSEKPTTITPKWSQPLPDNPNLF